MGPSCGRECIQAWSVSIGPKAEKGSCEATGAYGRLKGSSERDWVALWREAVAIPIARGAGMRIPELLAIDDTRELLPCPFAVYVRLNASTVRRWSRWSSRRKRRAKPGES